MQINYELDKYKDNFIKIEKDIENYIDELEDLYTSVYDKLPKVEEEIEITLSEMDILINYFFEDDSSDFNEDGATVGEILEYIKKSLHKLEDVFLQEGSIKETLDKFYNEQTEDGIDQLYKNIKKIETKVDDVEITSLNAIIYGAKLGDKGKSFVTITDEIIELSKKMDQKYKEIIKVIDQLRKWEESFKDNVSNIVELTEEIQSKSKDKINKLFSDLYDSLEQVIFLLKDQKESIEEAIEPIAKMMSSIQHQDILRQGLENLVKCLGDGHKNLEELIENDDNNPNDKKNYELDKITFAFQILQLSEELITNIEENFIKAYKELNAPVEKIREKILEIKEEGSIITDFLGGSGYLREQNVIKDIFNDIHLFIDQFEKELVGFEKEINNFQGVDSEFYENMKILNSKTDEIKFEVNFLKKFAVYTRIELARLDLEKSHFNKEVTGVTEDTSRVVNESCDQITSLNKQLEESLNKFEYLLNYNKTTIGNINNSLREDKERVDTLENLISNTVRTLGNSSDLLLQEVDKALQVLERGEDFSNKLNETKKEIYSLKEDIQELRDELLLECGLEEWEISKENLNEIINYLTTRGERIKAQDVYEESGVEVEAGSEGGDLTLF
ncbi:hypothetical protein [Natranaerofaba carboxydovora]|uniref:hypothetical protein n=1 Tax=Natranaerofaba carboxydovora TaxID=2742683 RepID=UPI001F1469C8|nr:hypothetical protein [Natranaerofaba carboxydovora]UMZ75062.1 Methyl-accepting chemotaxis protein 4 [Natranaerofaba carboxydovora]